MIKVIKVTKKKNKKTNTISGSVILISDDAVEGPLNFRTYALGNGTDNKLIQDPQLFEETTENLEANKEVSFSYKIKLDEVGEATWADIGLVKEFVAWLSLSRIELV